MFKIFPFIRVRDEMWLQDPTSFLYLDVGGPFCEMMALDQIEVKGYGILFFNLRLIFLMKPVRKPEM